VLFAPFAKLIESNFALNFLLIFSTKIISAFAGFAGKFYKLIL
jgi:hypothetical protein